MGAIKITFLYLIYLTEAYLTSGQLPISIIRHHKGDIFTSQGEKCYSDLCINQSRKTTETDENYECECKCGQHLPVYRDDLNICVDDIQECTLVPFVTGATSKRIPYVFLPLKGQIVNPSADIVISEFGAPICVVSGGQFLGRHGWQNIRNNSGTEPPFRLFRDEGRTYLQWFGESSMRMAMEGRVILVHLMCKDASIAEEPRIFTPCVAFRVAGNPNAREVLFTTDVHLSETISGGLSLREYVAIGLCSLFLAIVYVASVFFYLHRRAKKQKKSGLKKREGTQITLGEEGVIKNNPLLQANRHLSACAEDNAGYATDSNSCCSDPDPISDLLCLDDDIHQNVQTSAVIHPYNLDYGETTLNQDPNNIERLPEENVSIIETLETKDSQSETLKAMVSSSNGRRKLYFNPSYFEPELLKTPPPAALEFLVKIREVIAIAKHKMSNKKFSPSLLGIPEEDGSSKTESNNLQHDLSGTEESAINPEGKNSAQKTDYHFNSKNFYCTSDAKQRIIQKWLEDVPVMLLKGEEKNANQNNTSAKVLSKNKILNQSGLQLTNQENKLQKPMKHDRKRPSTKSKPPPLPPQIMKTRTEKQDKTDLKNEKSEHQNVNEILQQSLHLEKTKESLENKNVSLRPISPRSPPISSLKLKSEEETYNVKGKNTAQPSVAKNLMDAVIQELAFYKKNEEASDSIICTPDNPETEGVILCSNEQHLSKNNKTTTSKSTNQCDAIYNNSSNQLISELENSPFVKNESLDKMQDEHEYEVILLNPESKPIEEEKLMNLKTSNELGVFLKKETNERNEGYSLVSEVYVNDGSLCSEDSVHSCCSHLSEKSDKISYEVVNEKQGRLTIQVKDFSKQRNDFASESDTFEPDTLERKQRKSKLVQKIENGENRNQIYSNQRFHNDNSKKTTSDLNNDENFTDSLERPTIMLKTNGSFKRNSLEKDVNELFRNLNWARMENFGSLREIYEAKSRNHKRRTETTSLVDSTNSEPDCLSTLSWSEERRNKLLHRGIILHIDEDPHSRRKERFSKKKSVASKNNLLEKPFNSRSRSASPNLQSQSSSPTFKASNSESKSQIVIDCAVDNILPPSPPPRSLPASPYLFHCKGRSSTSSPISLPEGVRNGNSLSYFSLNSNTITRIHSQSENGTLYNSSGSLLTTTASQPLSFLSLSPTPPRPPKTSCNSPPLPPRNTKPPLPPKNLKSTKQKSNSSKLATRPLPPLPLSSNCKNLPSPTGSNKDFDTLSTLSGASMDSLNSSEYESFYTTPYEEEDGNSKTNSSQLKSFTNNGQTSPNSNSKFMSNVISNPFSKPMEEKNSSCNRNQRPLDSDKKLWKDKSKRTPNRVDDSGYLSTDSSESYCPQVAISSPNSKISEKADSFGGQNSETEESLCDGASESGAESTATDSFFYGNFKKDTVSEPKENTTSQTYFYSLKLSDVEVNSDTERHYVPIMVRPCNS